MLTMMRCEVSGSVSDEGEDDDSVVAVSGLCDCCRCRYCYLLRGWQHSACGYVRETGWGGVSVQEGPSPKKHEVESHLHALPFRRR